jgi:hypothetical protein
LRAVLDIVDSVLATETAIATSDLRLDVPAGPDAERELPRTM